MFSPVVALEQGDSFTKDILNHFNVSQLFFRQKYDVSVVEYRRLVITPNDTASTRLSSVSFALPVSFSVCDKLGSASIIISLARTEERVDLVAALAQSANVPVVQLHLAGWSPPKELLTNATAYCETIPL